LEKSGEIGYQLELPPQLSDVHDGLDVSQLKKCLRVPKKQIPMEDLDAKDLSYQVYPVKILETSEGVTQNKRIKMCKIFYFIFLLVSSFHTDPAPRPISPNAPA
jgi:hypothetical protein